MQHFLAIVRLHLFAQSKLVTGLHSSSTMNLGRFFPGIFLAASFAAASLIFAHAAPRRVARSAHVADSTESAPLPPIMVWAWERPEDLTTVDPRKTGVAFLARTVFLVGDSVSVRPRLQPLRLAPGTPVVAVVRVEVSHSASPTLSPSQLILAAHSIADVAHLPDLDGLQIDFDATASERAFYRDLLTEVRLEVPPSLPLAITALASWCIGDDWLRGLPIDDAIPMLFRMGAGDREVSLHLEAGGDFRAPACRQSLGISTDEPIFNLPKGRRLYIFNPRAWTAGTAQLATQMVHP